MAGSQKKSTKKFEKKHLKDVLERRKAAAKIKQRNQLKEKRKSDKAKSRAEREDDSEEDAEQVKKQNTFAEMNVDDFFAGGFDIADPAADKKKVKKKDVTPKIGKRKRSEAQEEEKEESSSGEEDAAQSQDEDEGSESEASELDDAETHKKDIEALKEKDPEFYKYLQENDAELLEFGDLAEVDALSEGEEEQDEEPAKKKKKKAAKEAEQASDLTVATVQKWQNLMEEQHSIRAMRQAVLAFRAATYLDDPDAQEQKYSISDSNVYHQVLVTALNNVPKVLAHHLPVKETASGKVRVSLDSKKFKTLTPLIKSHTSSVQKMLANLSDEQTLKLTLSSIEPMLPYLLQFRKLLKVLIKTIVGIWADASTTEATRIVGFLLLRRLMVIGDSGLKESVLKASYEGVVKGSRNTTVHTLPGVNLMKNSAAELWGIDQNVSYTTGFTFIRQLAMHLRGSITNNSKESYKTIYNWQYVHSLDFWSRVLSQHCDGFVEAKLGKQSALRPLIYPVVQITLGASRLIPTAQYLPLRFQLTRSLLRLSRASGTYIPLAPLLLEPLNLSELRKAPKQATLRPLDFTTTIRAPKSYLRTRVYQDGAAEQIAELLSEFFVLWSKHISFPELSIPVVVALKRWLKQVSSRSGGNRNQKVNQMILLLVQKVEANAKWIEEKRSHVTFAPRNKTEVEAFLKDVDWESTPLGAFVKVQRQLREEKAALLEEGRREEEKRRQEEKEVGDDVVMDDVASENDHSEDDEEAEGEGVSEEESEGEEEEEEEDDD
ncbi:Noc2p family-domain-containing protein [Aspergillus navahoensis]